MHSRETTSLMKQPDSLCAQCDLLWKKVEREGISKPASPCVFHWALEGAHPRYISLAKFVGLLNLLRAFGTILRGVSDRLARAMLVCLNQIAHLSLVCLPVLLALEIRISRAVPCVDLYKGTLSSKLIALPRHACLYDFIGSAFQRRDGPSDLKRIADADVHRPKVYSIDDIEEVSPIHGLAHKTIWYTELLCLLLLCVLKCSALVSCVFASEISYLWRVIAFPLTQPAVFMACSGMHHHGMKELEMWMQTLVPGTAIPPHTHGGEEVVIALKVTSAGLF